MFVLYETVVFVFWVCMTTGWDFGYDVFLMLWLMFVVVFVLFGFDKFFNLLIEWLNYFVGWVDDLMFGSA